MNSAVVAIGSNLQPKQHAAEALRRLGQAAKVLALAGPLATKALGPDGQADPAQSDYVNLGVLLETQHDQEGLRRRLRQIEQAMGRERTGDKFASRTIDLDIVVWNAQVCDQDVWQRGFLRQLVEQLCPEALNKKQS
jgi:2-amino-4-hydroxy-6-hydroxymethyldihydropteridine diphosphokinase